MEVVVLDFETTGLCPGRHRVIEIGAAIVNSNGEITKTFQTLCNPQLGKKLPKFIVTFTGITDSMLVGQKTNAEAMESLYEFIGDRLIIAHNASFDSKFLKEEMRLIGKEIFNKFLCTLLLSRRLLRTAGCYKLSFLKKFINFEAADNHSDHRALDDVLVTVSLWKKLLGELSAFDGIADESYVLDLLKMIALLPKSEVASTLEMKLTEIKSGARPVKGKRTRKVSAAACVVDGIQKFLFQKKDSCPSDISCIVTNEIVVTAEIVKTEHVTSTEVNAIVSVSLFIDPVKSLPEDDSNAPQDMTVCKTQDVLLLEGDTMDLVVNSVLVVEIDHPIQEAIILMDSKVTDSILECKVVPKPECRSIPIRKSPIQHNVTLMELDSDVKNVPKRRRSMRHSNPF